MGRVLARSSANASAWAGDGLEAHAASVWERGYVIPDRDPFFFRLDELGNEIHRWAYANAASPYGWEKDFVLPIALGGTGHITNLRPLNLRAITPERTGIVALPLNPNETQSTESKDAGESQGEEEILAAE